MRRQLPPVQQIQVQLPPEPATCRRQSVGPRPVTQVGLSLALVCATALTAGAKGVPSFEAKDLSGAKQSLASFRGKIVVLSFWATWCAPCKEELPRLSQLAQTYAGKDVEFIAVSIDEPKDRVRIQPFVDSQHISLKVWVGANADILSRFGLGDIVPGTVVLDRQGQIIDRIMGEARDQDVETRVDWLLQGRPGSPPDSIVKRY